MKIYMFPSKYKDEVLKEEGKRIDLNKVNMYQKIFNIDLKEELELIKKEEFSNVSIVFFTLTDDIAMKKANMYYLVKAYHSKKENKNSQKTYQEIKLIGERNFGINKNNLMKEMTKNVFIWSHKNSNNINDESTEMNQIKFHELISFNKDNSNEVIGKMDSNEKFNFLKNLENLTKEEVKYFDRELLMKLIDKLPLISNKVGGRI